MHCVDSAEVGKSYKTTWSTCVIHCYDKEEVVGSWRSTHDHNYSDLFHALERTLQFYQIFEIQTQKGSNERLFILTRTHRMQTFGEIPFIKPQNAT